MISEFRKGVQELWLSVLPHPFLTHTDSPAFSLPSPHQVEKAAGVGLSSPQTYSPGSLGCYPGCWIGGGGGEGGLLWSLWVREGMGF